MLGFKEEKEGLCGGYTGYVQGRERGGPYFDEPTVGHGPAVCFLRQQQKTKYMRAKRNTLSTSLAFFSVSLFPSPPLSHTLFPLHFILRSLSLSLHSPSIRHVACLSLSYLRYHSIGM